jgi:hypothetical protein
MMGRKVSSSFNHNSPYHDSYNALRLNRYEDWRIEPNEMFDIGNYEGFEHPHQNSMSEYYRHESPIDHLRPLNPEPEMYGFSESNIDFEKFEELPWNEGE